MARVVLWNTLFLKKSERVEGHYSKLFQSEKADFTGESHPVLWNNNKCSFVIKNKVVLEELGPV